MKALTFHIRLLEPMLVAQADSGEENSAISLPFIPGSALRGALIARYLQSHVSPDLAGDQDAQRLFFNGDVCFLNAYPWRENARLLPRPMSWYTEKEQLEMDNAEIWDMAVDPNPDPEPRQPKAPKGEFCHLTGSDVPLYAPHRQVNVHIALQDPNRRDDRNTVFRYDALAEGEVFAGVILGDDKADLKTIQDLFAPDEIHIGRAHTAGYGRAKIEADTIVDDWDEYLPDEDEVSPLIITLLSDTILRGEDGQIGGSSPAVLAQAIGLPQDTKPLRTYYRQKLVAGFNRKWSLPLVQSWGIEAGSVFVYEVNSAIDSEIIRTCVERGIGERRAEGFGRVAVGWQTQPMLQRISSNTYPESPPPLSPESKDLAQEMAGRRLRLLLEQKLVAAVNGVALKKPLPQNTQLSRVRTAVQQAILKGNVTLIQDHLNSLKGAKRQFETARVGGTPMGNWIAARVEKLDVLEQVWKSASMPVVAGETATFTNEIKTEFTARLIDGVMKKAIRMNQKEAVS
ncbi:MAG: hypothetical protein KJ638_06185 [Chloroflexi bacterium]|nr:hypothetical protein [Chloroflexota bacterium]